MDPAEVRRRNLVPQFTDRYTTGIGTVYDVGDYPEALERVLAAAGYDDLRAEQARRRAANDPIALGIGIAVYVEITAGAPGSEFGSVELLDGGRLRVRSGATPFGQGHDTTWAMVVSERTGVPIERHRGRPRRHRPGAVRGPHRRLALGADRRARRSPPQRRRWSISPASGPPTCSRRGRRRRARRRARPVPRRRDAGAHRRLGRDLAGGRTARRSAGRERLHARRCRRSRSAPTSPSSRSTPRRATLGSRRLVARRRRRAAPQPAARRGPGARRHRAGRRAGAVGGDALLRTTASRRPRTSPTTS